MPRTTTKKIEITDEMLEDIQNMSYSDFCIKWNVSTKICKKIAKEYDIETYYAKNGNRPHKFISGVEYKWCGKGHWDTLENFGKTKSRWDGLRWTCLEHDREYSRNQRKEQDPNAKKSYIRRCNFARRKNYIHWTPKNEKYIYDLFEGHCAYCGCPVDIDVVEFDHFIPIKYGGVTHPSNMLPSCVRCNRGVGGKMSKKPYDWLITYFGEIKGLQIYNSCVDVLEGLQ